MNRLTLERYQVWFYLAAIVSGLTLGSAQPLLAPSTETLLWPVLAMLLYVTFVQVPILHVRDAFSDRRFVLAVLIGNFVLMPALVWLIVQWLPADAALRLGVLLVLLVPCTDWFITFTQLGRGNTAGAIAVTPLNLIVQLMLLPFYLWLMLPAADFSAALDVEAILSASMFLIGLPLIAAIVTERWMESAPRRLIWRNRLAWWPVPLLAAVVFLIAAAQVGMVRNAGPLLVTVLPAFIVFLLAAALIARLLSALLNLSSKSGRTLAFSLGSRNSFVVLPIALALPAGWETTVLVIVLQSLIELFGMAIYVWWLPRHLFRDHST